MNPSPSKYLSPIAITMTGVLFLLEVYFLGARPWLSGSTIFAIELTLLGGLGLLAVGVLLFSLGSLVALVFSKNRASWLKYLRGQMIFLLAIFLLLAVVVGGSQWLVHTPPILGEGGQPLPNSIASLERDRLASNTFKGDLQ